jgi:hypothetical protein
MWRFLLSRERHKWRATSIALSTCSRDWYGPTLMRKKQNTRRNIAESIHKIYSYGMLVNTGFILGFDSEKGSVAAALKQS